MNDRASTKERRRRLDDLTDRIGSSDQGAATGDTGSVSSVAQNFYELFTKDVTREGLRDLLKRDPTATFRFFTRGIDFSTLAPLPWHKRYPIIVARIFIALAYQLSPPRRIAFAVACLTFLLGFLPRVQYSARGEEGSNVTVIAAGNLWWLISILIFALLLLMELRDKLSLKADLEIAREIQSGLVTSGLHVHGNFRFFCRMRPANTVGGDYCDLIDLEKDRIAVVIGDVAGKGMPAALLMALIQGSLRTLVTAGHRGMDLIAKLNSYLSASMPGNSFVTFFYGELNTVTGELMYVNAGHNPPIAVRPSGYERLGPTAMVLGVMDGVPIEAGQLVLGTSDHLLLYTDGIPEAANLDGEEYGEERLLRFLIDHPVGPRLAQSDLLEQLIAQVIAHCGDNRPHDDMTMISVVRNSTPETPMAFT